MNVPDKLVTLIASYLKERQNTAQYRRYSSDLFIPKLGVPQGSNSGPLLFLINVNDISTLLHYHYLLYADHVKINLTIANLRSCESPQDNLDIINEWCKLNNLILNAYKCKDLDSLALSLSIFSSTVQKLMSRINNFEDGKF